MFFPACKVTARVVATAQHGVAARRRFFRSVPCTSADNVFLDERLPFYESLEPERRKVQSVETSIQDELGQAASGRRRLLHAVAREAVGEPQVRQGRMRADDRVAVEEIHLVVARPGALDAQGLERR